MDKAWAVLIMGVVGGLVALQAPINAGLGKATGGVGAAVLNFTIGGILLVAILVLSGKAGGVANIGEVRWYYLLGGLFGAAYVFSALMLVDQIGAGGIAAATITGQLTLSVIIDRLGILGLEEVPITPDRVVGVALLLAGTFLIVR